LQRANRVRLGLQPCKRCPLSMQRLTASSNTARAAVTSFGSDAMNRHT
jgi:hypothetical protein